MIEIRHEKLNIEKPYRCIVVSDIHSHLDRFKQLLKEARYTTQDYLIIDGDFVEKNTSHRNSTLSSIFTTKEPKGICFTR